MRAVIEAVTGEPYPSFVKRRILDRANCPAISVVNDDPDYRRALYYPALSPGWEPGGVEYPNYTTDCGPGGYYGSVRDLARLLSALQANTLLTPDRTVQLFNGVDTNGGHNDLFSAQNQRYGRAYNVHNGATGVHERLDVFGIGQASASVRHIRYEPGTEWSVFDDLGGVFHLSNRAGWMFSA